MPSNSFDIIVSFLPGETRRLTRTGIQIHRLQYWAEALRPYASQLLTLQIHYDPRTIRVIYVRLPIGVVVQAEVTTPDIPDISLAEWNARRRIERGICKQPHLIATRIQSQQRADAIVSGAKASTKVIRRNATKAAGDRHMPKSLHVDAANDDLMMPPTNPTISVKRISYAIEGF